MVATAIARSGASTSGRGMCHEAWSGRRTESCSQPRLLIDVLPDPYYPCCFNARRSGTMPRCMMALLASITRASISSRSRRSVNVSRRTDGLSSSSSHSMRSAFGCLRHVFMFNSNSHNACIWRNMIYCVFDQI